MFLCKSKIFRSCAGSEMLDKQRGRAYNFHIYL